MSAALAAPPGKYVGLGLRAAAPITLQRRRDRTSDTTTAARDQRRLTTQTEFHQDVLRRGKSGAVGPSVSRAMVARAARANASQSIPATLRPRVRVVPSSSRARAPARLPLARC